MRYANFLNFPRRHTTLTPNNSTDIAGGPCILYCAADGVANVHDFYGNALTYTCVAGDIVPVMVRRLLSTSTTGTWYGLRE
jgi:hypothetical protein